MRAPALSFMPKTGSSSARTRMLPTANWPADMIPAMVTCGPEMAQIFFTDGRRSPSRSDAAITLISRPGRDSQTPKVSWAKTPVPPGEATAPPGAERGGKDPADHRRREEEGTQVRRPAPDQRGAREDERQDDQRQSEVFGGVHDVGRAPSGHPAPSTWC